MNAISTTLAVNLRRLRLAAGLTQGELAARSTVTVETVARIERVVRGRASANSNPSLDTLVGIAQALGVEVVDLLAGQVTAKPRDDRLTLVLRTARPAVRRRALHVVEALVREDSLYG